MIDLIHSVKLGLTRFQIYTVMSEATLEPDGRVSYGDFIPRAVVVIPSMLSFEKSVRAQEVDSIGDEAAAAFASQLEQALDRCGEELSAKELSHQLTDAAIDEREVKTLLTACPRTPEDAVTHDGLHAFQPKWLIFVNTHKQPRSGTPKRGQASTTEAAKS
ncbi:unnamed protein product [Vitrella brassicaformis CCMP3155]|uniref:Uncharacterized protein n=1 Tax=Vitrella brassicaformis (strain CCMP3155) TaxID=1169540 RepID=A0A0G4GVF3_VITBC|nr:unnamed protein product [Vitrella brassicaformis CCMP3155]|eukprot:CEM34867.1 unnamed protein product [Vitrella brassicaformis CCMP3155]